MNGTCAIVLAAGQGTRMKSDLPKVLVPVCGRPMIDYVLDMLAEAEIERVIVVVGYRADLIREHLAGRRGLTFVEQRERLGTGHGTVPACLASSLISLLILARRAIMLVPYGRLICPS